MPNTEVQILGDIMSRPRPLSGMRPDDVFYELSPVTEYLLLGGAPAVTVERIRQLGVTCVINVTELPNLPVAGVDYIRIAIDDLPSAQLSAFFDSAADAVEQQRRRGGRTLIHCVAGVSRSASLVLAHQVKHAGLSLREAFQRVRSRRAVVRPNAGFFQQLIEFERRVRGSASVRMVRHPAGGGELIPDVYETEYRRLIGWAEWLRTKNLAHRVSIFRSRGSASTGGRPLDTGGGLADTPPAAVDAPAVS
ncbi:dual specificity protein phosphatase 14-like isoform X2 [Pollicipes pollicipes]|uniref:dual specificity protein phosphatase 14-like isoform X2 n=1 Tax=Pollicipes pollicipes TaxID=41117 RepID=UPI001884BE9B|nr:dual specificity protein phosphatase 14-like isoform X2 [Pollicipes pollicipes]